MRSGEECEPERGAGVGEKRTRERREVGKRHGRGREGPCVGEIGFLPGEFGTRSCLVVWLLALLFIYYYFWYLALEGPANYCEREAPKSFFIMITVA